MIVNILFLGAGTILMFVNCICFYLFTRRLKISLEDFEGKLSLIVWAYQILIIGFLVAYTMFLIIGCRYQVMEDMFSTLICQILFWGSVFVYLCFRFLQLMLQKVRQARLTEMDALTCLFNKASGEKNIEQAMEGCKEELFLAIIDLDNFKDVNDLYGHLAGDQVIKKVAEIIRNEIASEDIACRFGGDEFIICVQGKTRDEMETFFDTLIEKIEVVSKDFPKLNLSASIGAASYSATTLVIIRQNMVQLIYEQRNGYELYILGEKYDEEKSDCYHCCAIIGSNSGRGLYGKRTIIY